MQEYALSCGQGGGGMVGYMFTVGASGQESYIAACYNIETQNIELWEQAKERIEAAR